MFCRRWARNKNQARPPALAPELSLSPAFTNGRAWPAHLASDMPQLALGKQRLFRLNLRRWRAADSVRASRGQCPISDRVIGGQGGRERGRAFQERLTDWAFGQTGGTDDRPKGTRRSKARATERDERPSAAAAVGAGVVLADRAPGRADGPLEPPLRRRAPGRGDGARPRRARVQFRCWSPTSTTWTRSPFQQQISTWTPRALWRILALNFLIPPLRLIVTVFSEIVPGEFPE